MLTAVLFLVASNLLVALGFVAIHLWSEARTAKAQVLDNAAELNHYRRYYSAQGVEF